MTLFGHRLDGRHLQVCVLGCYAFAARELFHFERTHLMTLVTVATAVGLDLLLGRFRYGALRWPLVALIVAFASSMQVDARSVWPFVFIAAVATLSKAFVTYKGRHFYNPANFGVVVLLLALPGAATGYGNLFSGYFAPTVVFFFVGTFTVLVARTAAVSFGWLGGFALMAAFRALVLGAPARMTFGAMANPMTLLFAFHMISDPATTPKRARNQVAFGLAVAVVDGILRMKEVPFGQFYALFGVSCLTPWIWDSEDRWPQRGSTRSVTQPKRAKAAITA